MNRHAKAKLSSGGQSLHPCHWEPENPSNSDAGKPSPCLLGLPSGPGGSAPEVLTFSGTSFVLIYCLCHSGACAVIGATCSQHLAEKALNEDLWMRNNPSSSWKAVLKSPKSSELQAKYPPGTGSGLLLIGHPHWRQRAEDGAAKCSWPPRFPIAAYRPTQDCKVAESGPPYASTRIRPLASAPWLSLGRSHTFLPGV